MPPICLSLILVRRWYRRPNQTLHTVLYTRVFVLSREVCLELSDLGRCTVYSTCDGCFCPGGVPSYAQALYLLHSRFNQIVLTPQTSCLPRRSVKSLEGKAECTAVKQRVQNVVCCAGEKQKDPPHGPIQTLGGKWKKTKKRKYVLRPKEKNVRKTFIGISQSWVGGLLLVSEM